MTVTPYDIGTYLVTSRTREDVEHLVDLSDLTCSCEAALDFANTTPENPCAHVEAALAFRAGAKRHRPRQSSPFALFHCQQQPS